MFTLQCTARESHSLSEPAMFWIWCLILPFPFFLEVRSRGSARPPEPRRTRLRSLLSSNASSKRLKTTLKWTDTDGLGCFLDTREEDPGVGCSCVYIWICCCLPTKCRFCVCVIYSNVYMNHNISGTWTNYLNTMPFKRAVAFIYHTLFPLSFLVLIFFGLYSIDFCFNSTNIDHVLN